MRAIEPLFLLLSALAFGGCPRAGDEKPKAREPCSKVGQPCEFSPGKLGSCVQRDDCSSGGCFVCQSQH